MQPEKGYSLNWWTDFTLKSCGLEPGTYVAVTEYIVNVWHWFVISCALTRNAFTISEP